MAKMTTRWREDDTEDHLINGRSGVGALKPREPGYVDATKKAYFITAGGQLRTFLSEQFLALPAAASSIGIVTPAGMSADTVQDAFDELAASVAGAGGGTIGGSAAAGSIPLMATLNTVAASVLTQVSDKILFEGDTVANLYRPYAGFLASDGGLILNDQLLATEIGADSVACHALSADIVYNNAAPSGELAFISALLTKDNSNARAFDVLKLYASLNAGASNANTILDVLSIDTDAVGLTGLDLGLLKLSHDGNPLWRVDAGGNLVLHGGSQTFHRVNDDGATYLAGGSSLSASNGACVVLAGNDNEIWHGSVRIYSGTDPEAFIDLYGNVVLSGYQKLLNQATPPTPTAGGSVNLYFKGTKLVCQFYDGGTVRYKYLDMSGTGEAWTHTTTAP
jgi:hypothetical protein